VTDLERRLKEAMWASVATVEPTFTAADVRRRHDVRVRRLTAMCLAVAMAMAVLAVLLPKRLARVDAATMTFEPQAGHTTSYTDPVYGWTITYNRALVEGRTVGGRQPDVMEAVRFTNFKPSVPLTSRGAVPMTWLTEFPATGVAFQVWSVTMASAASPRFRAELPLQLTRFRAMPRFVGGSEPIPLVQVFYGDGRPFQAAVWIGRLASPASKHAIWAAVRSVRFPPEPGRRLSRPPSGYAAPKAVALR
jgi:hypothetical protein